MKLGIVVSPHIPLFHEMPQKRRKINCFEENEFHVSLYIFT